MFPSDLLMSGLATVSANIISYCCSIPRQCTFTILAHLMLDYKEMCCDQVPTIGLFLNQQTPKVIMYTTNNRPTARLTMFVHLTSFKDTHGGLHFSCYSTHTVAVVHTLTTVPIAMCMGATLQ